MRLRLDNEEEKLNMLEELKGLAQDSGLEFYLMSQSVIQTAKLQASKFSKHLDQNSAFLLDRWK